MKKVIYLLVFTFLTFACQQDEIPEQIFDDLETEVVTKGLYDGQWGDYGNNMPSPTVFLESQPRPESYYGSFNFYTYNITNCVGVHIEYNYGKGWIPYKDGATYNNISPVTQRHQGTTQYYVNIMWPSLPKSNFDVRIRYLREGFPGIYNYQYNGYDKSYASIWSSSIRVLYNPHGFENEITVKPDDRNKKDYNVYVSVSEPHGKNGYLITLDTGGAGTFSDYTYLSYSKTLSLTTDRDFSLSVSATILDGYKQPTGKTARNTKRVSANDTGYWSVYFTERDFK